MSKEILIKMKKEINRYFEENASALDRFNDQLDDYEDILTHIKNISESLLVLRGDILLRRGDVRMAAKRLSKQQTKVRRLLNILNKEIEDLKDE